MLFRWASRLVIYTSTLLLLGCGFYPMTEGFQGLTVGQLLGGIESIVKTFENSGHSLIDHGDVVTGKQQLLLAGTLGSLADRLKSILEGSLNKTFDELDQLERDMFSDIEKISENMSQIAKEGFEDLESLVRQTQGAANQLLDRLPLVRKQRPLYYGFRTRDMLTEDPDPADIEVIGYRLIDDRLGGKLPEIRVNEQKIDSSFISAEAERVKIQLPEDIKNSINFEADPCEPVETFRLDIDVPFLEEDSLLWIIPWNTERVSSFGGRGVVGPTRYEVTVEYAGRMRVTKERTQDFAVRSGQARFGCEQTVALSANYAIPQSGAYDVRPSARIEGRNIKHHSANWAVSGNQVAATGTATGHDYEKYLVAKNCPGGGHAYLVLSGTYKWGQELVEDAEGPLIEGLLKKGAKYPFSIAQENPNLELGELRIEFKRRGCGQVFDTLHLLLPTDGQNIRQDSTSGRFSAEVRGAQATIASLDN